MSTITPITAFHLPPSPFAAEHAALKSRRSGPEAPPGPRGCVGLLSAQESVEVGRATGTRKDVAARFGCTEAQVMRARKLEREASS